MSFSSRIHSTCYLLNFVHVHSDTASIFKAVFFYSQTDSSAEDLLILRHQLSVLEKKFESEKQLSVDLNTELQSTNQTCSSLQDTNKKLTVKLTSVESQHKDVLDELVYKERKLEETQAILTKNRLEIDALSGLKETVRSLEAKVDASEVVKRELQHQTKVNWLFFYIIIIKSV